MVMLPRKAPASEYSSDLLFDFQAADYTVNCFFSCMKTLHGVWFYLFLASS